MCTSSSRLRCAWWWAFALIRVSEGTDAPCAEFRLRYLGSPPSEDRCLAVSREKERCTDLSASWSDGTNGCETYAMAEEQGLGWCEKYGGIDRGSGSARTACCACGGGSGSDETFGEGHKVRVRTKGGWVAGRVSRVKPSAGVAYEIRTGKQRVWVRRESSLEDDAEASLDLTRCDGSDERQRWQQGRGFNNVSIYSGVSSRETASRVKSSPIDFPLALEGDADAAVVHVRSGSRCLAGGRFGVKDFKRPQWAGCTDVGYRHLPVIMWEVVCGGSAGGSRNDTERLRDLAAQGSTATPWAVLGVDRDASVKDVKTAFRSVSLLLHPDKSDLYFSDLPPASVSSLYERARAAFEALRSDDERTREAFRIKHETTDQRFFAGSSVVELDRSRHLDLTRDANGTVLARITSNSTLEKVWVVILYSPSCSMSRSIAPLVKLAARIEGVEFGALACGFHSDPVAKGFARTFEDPACRAIEPGFSETPRVVALVEDPERSERAARWRLAHDSVKVDALVTTLRAFAAKARKLWHAAKLVGRITDFEPTPKFPRIVLLLDDSALSAAVLTHAPAHALPLNQAGCGLVVADCSQIDCPFAPPNALFFRANSSRGHRLLPEPFGDLRDAQVALSAFLATLSALSDDVETTSALDDGLDVVEQQQEATLEEAGACDAKSDPRTPSDRLPQQAKQSEPPADRTQIESSVPKLAQRPEPKARRARRGGGGVVYGAGVPVGGGGAFGGTLPGSN